MITRFLIQGMDRNLRLFVLLVLAVGIALPLLNQLVPPGNPFHVPAWLLQLIGKYLSFALLALAVDLVWGYCGILSLGHGAFFALGGYCMGMYLMRQIGSRGVYGNPLLPDFMVFLNYKELPWFWYGFDNFGFAMLMAILVPSVLAFALGWFAFRSRVTGVYLSIITQAMTFALMLAFFRNDMGLGGNNGMTDFKEILGFSVQADSTRAALCFASAVMLALGLIVSAAIVGSRFGKALTAVRDAESRMRFLGYRVEGYKLFVFVFSAAMAGIAGALYVPQVGIINPSEFSPANSIEAVIWVAVGGRGTLIGPVIGAFIVNFGKTWLTGALPEFWLFALGALFIVVTLLLPKGVVGLWAGSSGSRAARKRRPTERPHDANSSSTSALLYLDGVTVSFDGFKALNNLSLSIEPGEMRAIIGPNGAGKTTMMDVITGKTRPDVGDGRVRRPSRSHPARRGRDRRPRHRPEVPEADGVREPHRRDNLLLALAGDCASGTVCCSAQPTRPRANGIDEILAIIRLERAAAYARRAAQPRPEAMARDRHAAGAGSQAAAGRRAGRRHDRRRDRRPPRSCCARSPRLIRSSSSSTTWASCATLGVKVTVLHEGSVLAEGTLDQVSADQRVVEVYLGR